MFLTSLLIPLVLMDGVVSRHEGFLLVCVAVVFTYIASRRSIQKRKDTSLPPPGLVETDAEAAGAPPRASRIRLAGIALVGLILLIVGGQVFVNGASGLALAFGLSQRVVGLTVAAVGTSTPELAASIIAALRGHPSIAVGNVIGSNIFNAVSVLGGVAAIRPVNGSISAFGLDLVCLVVISAIALILVRSTRLIRRAEGALLILCYGRLSVSPAAKSAGQFGYDTELETAVCSERANRGPGEPASPKARRQPPRPPPPGSIGTRESVAPQLRSPLPFLRSARRAVASRRGSYPPAA
jgi:Ca2+/Na+ antiporter